MNNIEVEEEITIPKTRRLTMIDDETTILEKHHRENIEENTYPLEIGCIPMSLCVDAFMDPSYVAARVNLNNVSEIHGPSAEIMKQLIMKTIHDVSQQEDRMCDDAQFRVLLYDRNINQLCRDLVSDVRCWSGILIPILYKSSSMRIGIHSVEIRRALDIHGDPTTQGPKNIYNVYLYLYSDHPPELSLIFERPPPQHTSDTDRVNATA